MGRPKKNNDYVDNEVLKELLQKYIESNPADQGQWLEKYEKTMRTRTQNKPDKCIVSAASTSGTVILTISQPTASSERICLRVAFLSCVSVFVID